MNKIKKIIIFTISIVFLVINSLFATTGSAITAEQYNISVLPYIVFALNMLFMFVFYMFAINQKGEKYGME